MIGYWNPRSVALLPPGNYSLQGKPYRAYSIMKGNKIVGSMRRNTSFGGWVVNITGFIFYTVPGQGLARFGAKETTVKHFPSSSAAREAIKEAFQQLKFR